MTTFKQFEDERHLLKYSTPEQSKCTWLSFQGIKVPLYRFGSQSLTDVGPSGGLSCIPEEEQSILDSLLLAQWEERMWKGLFKYDVTTSEIKVIGGKRKFLAQLNKGWNMDCFPVPEENNVCHKGRPFVFNWMKDHEELLFCVAHGEKANPELIPAAAVPNGAILILINATPVEYGHVFLVPCGYSSLFKFLDARSLDMVTRIAVEINHCSFCLFYDCCTPSASHPYFQGCYFPNPLPVELLPVMTLFGDGQAGIRICQVTDYPIRALLFESNDNLKVLVEVVAEICSCLLGKNIPYNLLISDCGKKMFLFPQLQTLASSCTLSAWECGGYFLFKSGYEFDCATEEAMIKRLNAVSLDDEGFQAVNQLCCSIASKFTS
ncbi:hypothetical protein L1049_009890 [Liquidambar formosana]|uniref:GDP-L-galactose phosphorylase 1 n=1 Tax=Liquidambar formosana TaxID=63359 RepID=A0AAP0R3X1_LIQFO